MTPIGIVTRNRAAYLDVTLRSLSATRLPDEQPLVVFDDASDNKTAKQYLYTGDPVKVEHRWPTTRQWQELGLDIIKSQGLSGIAGRVEVVRAAEAPCGVINASCKAFVHLFERFPDAPGAFLLQDDIVLNVDWHERMTNATRHRRTGRNPQGLLAGIRVNGHGRRRSGGVTTERRCVTAQCYYLHRDVFEKAKGWFLEYRKAKRNFDVKIGNMVRNTGFEVHLIHPFVCQHIGVVSLVRPHADWTKVSVAGRIGYDARPPYAMAEQVRCFRPKRQRRMAELSQMSE